MQRGFLLLGVSIIEHVLARWQVRSLADLAEKRLHLASRLVDIDDLAFLVAHTGPHMGHLARQEDALPGTHAKLLLANVKLKLPIHDVDPLILVVMAVARAAAVAGELEHTHRALR